MNRSCFVIFLFLTTVLVGQNKPHTVTKPETPHLQFVKEFVRELISDESLKATAEKEFSEAKSTDEQFSTALYISKSMQLELRSQILVMKSMHLEAPYEELIPDLISSYKQQIDLEQGLIEISTNFLGGPKPGVDYSALRARVPQLRAELENAQKIVFTVTPLVFMTLIDPKPDSQNHVSHLRISKDEKSELKDELELLLNGQSEHGDHDYYISAAMVLRGAFEKGHKCADEPWD